MRNEDGREIWEGYCIDFVKKLSIEMQFDYELVIPDDQEFGKKLPNGEWTGLIGDLAKGVDILFSISCSSYTARILSLYLFINAYVHTYIHVHVQETDIVVAALTMTSEREEVIDFVAPYFEQSGILIGIQSARYCICTYLHISMRFSCTNCLEC